jgi:hypothetical protein
VRFESADTISASFTADTGVTRRLAAVPCGPKRACAPGWDLRVVRVTAPRGPVPTAGRFSVIVDVDNHGRVASPASELRVCTSFGDARCSSARGESVGVIDVPTLAPGETIRFAHVVLLTAPNETDGWSVVAQIDPDGTSGEVNQANNAGRSTPIATQLPALEWLAFEVPSVARAGTALPLTVRIRNKSVAATSAPVEVQFYGAVDRCPRAGMAPYTWGHDGPHRLMVPAIGPRQVVVLTLAVTDALACGLGEASITAVVDPDATRKWSASTEREIGRQFSVQ